MSNSKLLDHERDWLRQFKRDNPGVVFFSFPDLHVTVGIRETGMVMGEFAVSIASDTEQKFRRKVGEYHAARRFYYDQLLPVKLVQDMEVVAEDIAHAVSGSEGVFIIG